MRFANVFFVDESKVMFKVMVTITKHEIFLPFPPQEQPTDSSPCCEAPKAEKRGKRDPNLWRLLSHSFFFCEAFLLNNIQSQLYFFPLWAKDSPLIKGVKETAIRCLPFPMEAAPLWRFELESVPCLTAPVLCMVRTGKVSITNSPIAWCSVEKCNPSSCESSVNPSSQYARNCLAKSEDSENSSWIFV